MAKDRFFDPEEGRRRKEADMERVAKTNADWMPHAARAIVWCARRMKSFTTDHVWYRLFKAGAPAPKEPRAMGPAMSAAERDGVIAKIEGKREPSMRPCHHQCPVQVWRSLICER